MRRVATVAVAALGLLSAVGAAGAAPVRVFEVSTSPIVNITAAQGRGVWLTRSQVRECDIIHTGLLERGENAVITPCVDAQDSSPFTSAGFTIGRQDVAAAKLPGTHGLKAIWRQFGGGNNESDWMLLASTPGGGATKLGFWDIPCGAGNCFSGGNGLGPVAGRDGVLLYSVIHWTATCSGDVSCLAATGPGGSIRRVVGGGTPPVVVPGAPEAAEMVTAGGRLAEQTFDGSGHPSATIQIRDAITGGLLGTIASSGTIHAMAMSQTELVVLEHGSHGTHLDRYDAHTGAPLGSTWLQPGTDLASVAIEGNRIVYQNHHEVRVFRIDLGRATTVYRQDQLRIDLLIDQNGVRWVVSKGTGEGASIQGIDFR